DTAQIKCYALSSKDESVWRQKIEDESEHFCDVSGLQNGDVARLIHADGIDILINLNGYTKGARNEIFALQPAPIQVSRNEMQRGGGWGVCTSLTSSCDVCASSCVSSAAQAGQPSRAS
ncbi:unnamed protein product, partial [Laminaria digitata]